jgi:superfamily II RNA helicase
VSLLEKGVAIHHSKMLPVLREIVEILFAKGYIKVLFATESVAIGLNLPVKTTVFTDIHKFDGDNIRLLQGHEYTQAAGRAGRLGLDTVGHVIHLNNLFRDIDSVGYRTMMNGKPQALVSKFKISYHLLLSLIDIGDQHFIEFSRKSMVKDDLDSQLKEVYDEISKVSQELDVIELSKKHCRTPEPIIHEYLDLCEKKPNAVNKKRKEIDKRIQDILYEFKYIESDKETLKKCLSKQQTLQQLEEKYKLTEKYIDNNVNIILHLLELDEFIIRSKEADDQPIQLTLKGTYATCLREVPCLIFAKIIENNDLFELTTEQLICFLSCFTNITVQEDYKDYCLKTEDATLIKILEFTKSLYDSYQNKELEYQINTGTDYTIHYDLLDYVKEWIVCEKEEDCKILLQHLESEKGIFLGEFVKALLKINNIACELEKIAELTGKVAFLSQLKEIPNLLLKYVVTNQSLYI